MQEVYATLVEQLEQPTSEEAIVSTLQKAERLVSESPDAVSTLDPEDFRALVSKLSTWVGTRVKTAAVVPTGSRVGPAMEGVRVLTETGELQGWVQPAMALLSYFLGLDSAADTIATQKGVLLAAVALLAADAGDSLTTLSQCIEVLASLSLVESADKTLKSVGAVPILLSLLQRHASNRHVQQDIVTVLALMAKRTRLRQVLTQSGGVKIMVDLLREHGNNLPLTVAICRFLRSYVVDREQSVQICAHGGIDVLLEEFFDIMLAGEPPPSELSPADVGADVLATIWACSTDCIEVQKVLPSEFFSALLRSLTENENHSNLHEAAIGLVRNSSKNATFKEDIVKLEYPKVALEAMRKFGVTHLGLCREVCGFVGSLAAEGPLRAQLAELSAAPSVLDALSHNSCYQDRKLAMLALGALVNLTNCERSRQQLAETEQAPANLLEATRVFIGNESILELAVGAISHLAIDGACALQLIEAGAVEAILVFLTECVENAGVVSKCLMALRRLYHGSISSTDGDTVSPVAARLSGDGDAVRGTEIIVEAVQAHEQDRGIVKEACQLLSLLGRRSVNVPVLLKVAVRPLLRAMEIHKSEDALCDLIANFLSTLPLEEEGDWDKCQDDPTRSLMAVGADLSGAPVATAGAD